MRQEDRMGLILEELAGGGSVGVAEIAAKLGVSTASIRRDLQLLEKQRLLSRTHGGAVANSTAYELPLRYRGGRRREEKRRIAAAAAARVSGDVASVGLTGGTTTTEVARRLADRQGLTVVTNALNIAAGDDELDVGAQGELGGDVERVGDHGEPLAVGQPARDLRGRGAAGEAHGGDVAAHAGGGRGGDAPLLLAVPPAAVAQRQLVGGAVDTPSLAAIW